MNFFRKRAALIVIGLIAVFLGSMVATGLFRKKESAPSPTAAPAPEEPAEPAFTHEGDLAFISATGDTITTIAVEIAETETETTTGLMFRKKMDNNQGMIFIFPDEQPRSFWMKNTYLPLDIIYISADSSIVSVQDNTTPYSIESLPSEGPARFVVEVNAGFRDKYSLKKGDRIRFVRTDKAA